MSVSMPTGQPELSFPDREALGWAALLAGLACLGGGALLIVLVAAEGFGELDADAMAGLCLMAFLLLFGLGFSLVSLRDIVGKPTWHVSSSHVWRMRSGRPVDVLVLSEQPSATVVDVRRNGITMWFAVRLGDRSIAAPSPEAAQRIAELWQKARR